MTTSARYEKFKELLKEGMGTRSQKEFAKVTGIARETISRMLNKEEIPQPSKDTLARIAKNISNCTLNDLYESCGYPRVSLEEDVENKEGDLLSGIAQLCYGKQVWNSVEDFTGTINVLWLMTGAIKVSPNEREVDEPDNPADFCRNIIYNWTFEDLSCEFIVRMYYVKSGKGNIVFTSYEPVDEEFTDDWVKNDAGNIIDETRHILHTHVIRFTKDTPSKAALDNLLNSIFGSGSYYVDSTVLGIGFKYSYESEDKFKSFKDFVSAHASSFCTSETNRKIFEHISNNINSFKECDDYLCDNDMSVGSVIAKIMKEETGMAYEAYPDNDANSIMDTDSKRENIMYECKNKKEQMNPSAETLYTLHQYAAELEVPEFGACYYEIREIKTAKTYKTDEFYLNFSNKN